VHISGDARRDGVEATTDPQTWSSWLRLCWSGNCWVRFDINKLVAMVGLGHVGAVCSFLALYTWVPYTSAHGKPRGYAIRDVPFRDVPDESIHLVTTAVDPVCCTVNI
jgi:hypothetical protein